MINIFRIIYTETEQRNTNAYACITNYKNLRKHLLYYATMLGFEQLSSKLILKAFLSSTELNI